MKLIFLGTPDFAAAVLRRILKSAHVVTAVVTQPDRPANRNVIKKSPVKSVAEEYGLPVLQFEKIRRDGTGELREIDADIMVTCAYGQILSQEILDMKKYGVINVHASLLPKYRGSSPIQWAVINGDKASGVTVMQTAYEVDSGDILLQKPIDLAPDETGGSLFERLAELGGEAIVEALDMIEGGRAAFTPQDDDLAVYVPMLKKSDGLIDFSKTAEELDRFARGMTPWPSAYCYLNGTMFKVFRAQKHDYPVKDEPYGTVLYADGALVVRCGDGAARLVSIQPENGKRMSDTEYLRGHTIEKGARFGAKL